MSINSEYHGKNELEKLVSFYARCTFVAKYIESHPESYCCKAHIERIARLSLDYQQDYQVIIRKMTERYYNPVYDRRTMKVSLLWKLYPGSYYKMVDRQY